MLGFWRTFGELLPLGIAGVCVLAGTLVAWGRVGKVGQRRLTVLFLAIWGLSLAAVTLWPSGGWLDANNNWQTRGINLTPLSEIGDALTNSVTWHVPVEQIGGNLLLFAPLGIAIVMVAGQGVPRWTGFVVGFGVGLTVEVMQWLLNVGRVSSVDDVLLAALGAGLGLLLALPLFRRVTVAGSAASEREDVTLQPDLPGPGRTALLGPTRADRPTEG